MEVFFNYIKSHCLDHGCEVVKTEDLETGLGQEGADIGTGTKRLALFDVLIEVRDGRSDVVVVSNQHLGKEMERKVEDWVRCCERTLRELMDDH